MSHAPFEENNLAEKQEILSGKIQVIDENYYQELFLLELKYKKECRPELISEILQKYQNAIEYYNAIDSEKTKPFEFRMRLFITRPEVVVHLKANTSTGKSKVKDISEDNKIKKESQNLFKNKGLKRC